MSVLTMLLPTEAMPLLLLLSAVFLILGMKRFAGTIVVFVLLSVLLGPFVDAFVSHLIGTLPSWVLIVAVVLGTLVLFRLVVEPVLGKEATGHVMAGLLAGALRIAFLWPFRLLRWVFQRGR